MRGVWLWLPGLGPIRITTVLMGVVILLWVGVWTKRPWIAYLTMVGWAASYEVIFNAVGVFLYHWPLGTFAWAAGALLGWILLAYREGIRPSWVWVTVMVVAWIPWLLEGFHSNIPVGRPWDAWGEVLNVVTKTALGIAFLIGAPRLTPSSRAEQQELVEEPVNS